MNGYLISNVLLYLNKLQYVYVVQFIPHLQNSHVMAQMF